MTTDISGFVKLCEKFATIDLLGEGPVSLPGLDDLEQAIRRGSVFLPQIYRDAYVAPLLQNLSVIIERLQNEPDIQETLTGAVYEHRTRPDIWKPLDRFLAVISNLYRSFLSKEKLAAIDVPFEAPLPPLAMFQRSSAFGPFTIPSDQVEQLIGVPIGVVSLPATYRFDPLIWATLAHETGGHDITHADPDLLPELQTNILALFGIGSLRPDQPPRDRLLDGLLWRYWMDEATADVYGLLNVGPVFALNQSAFFAALRHAEGLVLPSLSMRSQADPNSPNPLALDPHPTDILRLHLAIGVIENLKDLSPQTRKDYIEILEQVALLCARGINTVEIHGQVALTRDVWIPIDAQRPLVDMQQSARQVGAYLATAKLEALEGHSIQDIETWSDADEVTAQGIMTAFLDEESVVNRGDDAQLLAGATLAVLARPRLYDRVTELLEKALDQSFVQDPIWGLPVPHPVVLRYREGVRV